MFEVGNYIYSRGGPNHPQWAEIYELFKVISINPHSKELLVERGDGRKFLTRRDQFELFY
jgi:hypothetical protein